ncbi:hypothetical protein [Aestuariirhabdus sp. LZHN29]|uniref:hypothetical protein n=1 Tax=Aestuariirhabdus sp. LZHN29 TaxID=3417462 RepID=UPI003CF03150
MTLDIRTVQSGRPLHLTLTAVGIATLFQALYLYLGVSPVNDTENWDLLWDPDSYTHLLRVLELHQTGAWFDSTIDRFNPPVGTELHWSRAQDLLLISGAWIGTALWPFDQALHGWGIFLAPALQLLSAAILCWGFRPLLGKWGSLLLIVLFCLQRGTALNFVAGFPDHHATQLMLMAAVMATMARSLAVQSNPRLLFVAGILSAIQLWVSVEGLVLVLASMVTLGGLWVFQHSPTVAGLRRFATGLAIGVTLALIIERPPSQWVLIDYDRLSLLHLVISLASLLTILLLSPESVQKRLNSLLKRFGAGILAATLLSAMLIGLFPYLISPYGAQQSAEVKSLIASIYAESSFLPNTPATWFNFILETGPLLFTGPFVIYQLIRAYSRKQTGARWIYYLCWMGVTSAYCLHSSRGVPFMVLAYLPAWVELLSTLGHKCINLLRRQQRRAGSFYLLLAGLVLCSHWVVGWNIAGHYFPGASYRNPLPYHYSELLQYLPRTPNPGSDTILSDTFSGPELAYKSNYQVLAAPYHIDTRGIRLSRSLLANSALSPESYVELKKHRVRYILLPRSALWRYDRIIRSPSTLLGRLVRNRPPKGIERISLPRHLQRQFLLYRVQH